MYSEIKKLALLLWNAKIPHTFKSLFDGFQIKIERDGHYWCDIIEHFFSYGGKEDLVEIAGLQECKDDVIGGLSAEKCFEMIKKEWEE